MFDLNCLFQLFEWHACKLACVAKCMSTINKHLTLFLTFLTFCPRELSLCHVVQGEDWVPVSGRVGHFACGVDFYPVSF